MSGNIKEPEEEKLTPLEQSLEVSLRVSKRNYWR